MIKPFETTQNIAGFHQQSMIVTENILARQEEALRKDQKQDSIVPNSKIGTTGRYKLEGVIKNSLYYPNRIKILKF